MEKGNLADSLAKAQAEIGGSESNKENKFLKNKYADLSSVFKATRKALTKYGIAVTQTFETLEDGTLFLKTSLLKGTESINSRLPIQWVKDWHSMGSAISYARRYSLMSLTGTYSTDPNDPDSDDDGSIAMGHDEKPPTTKSSKSLPRRNPDVLTQERAYSIISQIPHAETWLMDICEGETDVVRLAIPIAKRIIGLKSDGVKKKVEEYLKGKEKSEKTDSNNII